MESLSKVQKTLNIIKPKLNIDICQIILKFESICFIISQLSDYNSTLKHNYRSLKENLEALTSFGLLTKFSNGLRSGKNYSVLYIKQLPTSLSPEQIEEFSLKYLNKINMCWSTYFQSCRKIILSSKFAILSSETSKILNNGIYNSIVQQDPTKNVSAPTIKKTIVKNCTKKNNRKTKKLPNIEKNQNSILRYFHPIPSTNDSSKMTNQNLPNNIIDHDDDLSIIEISSSSPSYQPSTIIRSKYFINESVKKQCRNPPPM